MPLPDRTYEGDTPFGNTSHEFSFKSRKAIDQSPEELGAGNQIPLGWQLVEIGDLSDEPKAITKRVFVNNKPMDYHTHQIGVTVHNAQNPGQTVRFYMQVPPDDPAEMQAYQEGYLPDKNDNSRPGKAKGFFSNAFYNFIGSIGFPYKDNGGVLPDAACNCKNWKGKRALCKINPPQDGKNYNQIAICGFMPISPTGSAPDGGMAALAAIRAGEGAKGGKGKSAMAERTPLAASIDEADGI